MNQNILFSSKNIKTVAIITIIFIILSLGLSMTQRPKYQASVKLLTIFNQSNIDPYTASRTSEYITSVLGEVIYSNSFIDNIFKTDYEVVDTLGSTQEKREKNWKKMVKIRIQETKGVIEINVLHKDRNQAFQFAQAITHTLVTKNQMYHGFGDKISIKIINSPIVSAGWAQPKLISNGFMGLAAGIIIGLTFVVLFPQQDIFKLMTARSKKNGKASADNNFDDMANAQSDQDLISQYNFYTPQPGFEMAEAENTPAVPATKTEDDSSKNQFYNW